MPSATSRGPAVSPPLASPPTAGGASAGDGGSTSLGTAVLQDPTPGSAPPV